MKQKLEIDKYRHAPIYMNFNSQGIFKKLANK